MAHRFRNLLAITSAAAMVLCVAAWTRSHHAGEMIGREAVDHTGTVSAFRGVFSAGGQLALGSMRVHRREGLPEENLFEPRRTVAWSWRWRRDFLPFPFLTDSGSDVLDRLKFGLAGMDTSWRREQRYFRGVGVPHALVALLLAVLPTWVVLTAAARWIRAAERQRLGRCVHCGYDLRATRADRCPECGAAVASSPVDSR